MSLNPGRYLPIQALPHVFQLVNDLLVPTTIDSAVYNELDLAIRKYEPSRAWTVGDMDGAAARGRLDLLKKLRCGRSMGCSSAAFIGAARNNYVEVLEWLHRFYQHKSRPVKELTVAAEHGHMQTIAYLRSHMRGQHVGPALEAAARIGDVAVVEAILPGPVIMDQAFAAAAANGHVPVVQLLLDRSGRFPFLSVVLSKGAQFGHIRVMELVIDRCEKRDLNAALPIAAGAGQFVAVRMLLRRGIDVSAIATGILTAAKNNHCDVITFLLHNVSSLESSDNSSSRRSARIKTKALRERRDIQEAINRAVLQAVREDRIDVVRLLIERTMSRLSDLLREAASKVHVEIMELLLDVTQAKNIKKHRLYAVLTDALEKAASRGSIEMAQLLVGKFKDADTSHALKIAVAKKDTEMVNVLIEKSSIDCKVDALFRAAAKGNLKRVKALLQVNDQETIHTALVRIAMAKNVDMAKLVLENCDPSAYAHIFADAAENDLVVLVQQLLDEVEPQSITRALTRAAARRHTEVVELLMDKSDPSSINYAVEEAAMEGRADVINLLRDRCDRDSIENAVEKARNAGYGDIVKLLTNKIARTA